MAIPILASTDLDRTAAFVSVLGLEVAEFHVGYLRVHCGPVEVHFSQASGEIVPGWVFLHVPDAMALWKELRDREVPGVGPIEDRPYGIREFVVTDPDGNRIRVGSPIPAEE